MSSVTIPRAVSLGLVAHANHQVGPEHALGKAGEIFDFGGQIELSQRQRAAEAVFLGDRAS